MTNFRFSPLALLVFISAGVALSAAAYSPYGRVLDAILIIGIMAVRLFGSAKMLRVIWQHRASPQDIRMAAAAQWREKRPAKPPLAKGGN